MVLFLYHEENRIADDCFCFAFYIGQLCTLSTPHGPQVGDLNLFSLANPRERFWASRTKQLHASHVSVGDRLWSCLPYMRPLATIVGDSLVSCFLLGRGFEVVLLMLSRRIMVLMGWGEGFMICWGRGVILMVCIVL